MHRQAAILDDQKKSEESDMMQDVLKVHASKLESDLSSLREQSDKESFDQSDKDSFDQSDKDWYLDTADNIPHKWEDFVPRWQKTVQKIPKKVIKEDNPILGIAAVVDEIKRGNGANTVVMRMTKKCDYADAFIFTQGNNTRHVSAIVEAVKMLAKSKIKTDSSLPKSIKVTSAKGQDWVIVDMGKYIMHVFTQEAREYYDLEGLWAFVIDPMKRNEAEASNILASLSESDKH